MEPAAAPQSDERVLSTLNSDGSRRWLKPRLSKGRFLTRRRVFAYALIAVFTLIPYLSLNGKPLVLLDILHREFTLFGKTFLPTDTLLLALLVVSIFVMIFLLTALFGRVWCGWACPQTVYMEFLYRPIERFFEGAPGKKKKMGGWRKPAKYAVYLLVSMFLAHTVLAYFVGVDQLAHWVTQSPLEHPTSFIVMAAVTGLMLFDFGFFREQTCLVACPYGRFQSVMLDRHSLIITYDQKRGEPRGKMRKPKKGADVALDVLPERGDCIDCRMCVTTCPTGIDIRDGLQMECIGCAQCIDACDSVMDKISKPRGLIRYSSEARVEDGDRRLLRPRVVLYPLILAIVLTGFVVVLTTKDPADVTVLRGMGLPYTVMPDGRVLNQLRVKITNRDDDTRSYALAIEGVEGWEIMTDANPVSVEPGVTHQADVRVLVPKSEFGEGTLEVVVVIDAGDFQTRVPYRMLGPAGSVPTQKEDGDD